MTRKSKRQAKPEEPEEIFTKWQLDKSLKPKRKRFAQEYVNNGWNATRSYKLAYKVTDDNQAAANGAMLIRNNKVKQYIDYIKTDYELLCGISKARQIKEYMKIAYSSIAYLHLTWIELKNFRKIKRNNPDALDAIESTEHKTEQRIIDKEVVNIKYIKLKFHPKIVALTRIDKLMDYETAKKIEHSGEIDTSPDLSKYSDEEKKLLLQIARKG